MIARRVAVATVTAVLAVGGVVVAPQAGATEGWWRIDQDTTLVEDHVGTIYLGTPGITLDCAGHTVSGGPGSGYHGILVDVGIDDATVRNCRVTGFGNGITVYGADRALIVDNDAFRNDGAGIVVAESSSTSVMGNRTTANGDNGIQVENTFQIEVAGNEATRNRGTGGIATRASTGGRFHDNVVARNTHAGLNLGTSTNDTVDTNVVRANEVGIWFENDTASFVTHNTVWRSRAAAIAVRAGSETTIAHNTLRNHRREGGGIYLYELARRYRVEFNRVRGASRGLTLVDATDNVIRRNSFRASLSEGIIVEGGSVANLVKRNRSIGSAATGIWFGSQTSDNVIVRNVACRSGGQDALDNAPPDANTWIDNEICDRA